MKTVRICVAALIFCSGLSGAYPTEASSQLGRRADAADQQPSQGANLSRPLVSRPLVKRAGTYKDYWWTDAGPDSPPPQADEQVGGAAGASQVAPESRLTEGKKRRLNLKENPDKYEKHKEGERKRKKARDDRPGQKEVNALREKIRYHKGKNHDTKVADLTKQLNKAMQKQEGVEVPSAGEGEEGPDKEGDEVPSDNLTEKQKLRREYSTRPGSKEIDSLQGKIRYYRGKNDQEKVAKFEKELKEMKEKYKSTEDVSVGISEAQRVKKEITRLKRRIRHLESKGKEAEGARLTKELRALEQEAVGAEEKDLDVLLNQGSLEEFASPGFDFPGLAPL